MLSREEDRRMEIGGCEGFLKENAERKSSYTMFLQQNNRRILEELQLWPSSHPDKD